MQHSTKWPPPSFSLVVWSICLLGRPMRPISANSVRSSLLPTSANSCVRPLLPIYAIHSERSPHSARLQAGSALLATWGPAHTLWLFYLSCPRFCHSLASLSSPCLIQEERAGVTDSYIPLCGGWELNQVSWGAAGALTTEPSLQPVSSSYILESPGTL